MKRFELEIEHFYKDKFIGRKRCKSNRRVLVIGQGRSTDLRLLGDDVGEIHAYIEFRENEWFVIDAGSEGGTWMAKKPITEAKLDGETLINIGGHRLKLVPHEFDNHVFSKASLASEAKPTGEPYHQIIIKRKDSVARTEMVPSQSSFEFYDAGKTHILTAPQPGEVKTSSIGVYELTQRIAYSHRLDFSFRDILANLKNPEMRTPIIAVVLLLFILSGLILAIPSKPTDDMAAVTPDNKYTRMIFDAELMKKKRAEAKEMRKTIMAAAPKSQQTMATAQVKKVSAKAPAPKVVSDLKLSGLNSLLGKIAKRANVNAPKITAFGKTPDDPNTAQASIIPSVSNVKGAATGTNGQSADTYKVGAVATAGRGGGNGRALAGVAGLAVGGAGSSTVGVLDEETEIEGGLDKDVIARVISNYLGEVRYCYERQLSSEPDIYGKVQIKFTIDANGAVSEQKIGVTTLKSAMVEGCILRRLARWKFPKPKGGTHVLVTYPFMFKSTN